jgi:uncharacterized membrane protein YdjX (TVP38/TMEM64 family)
LPTARRRFTLLAVVVTGLGVGGLTGVTSRLPALVESVRLAGSLGPVLAVLGAGVLAMVMVPRSLLAAAAGLVFGTVAGAGYVLVGVLLGGTAAFGLARALGRDFVEARGRFRRLDRWLLRRGVATVAVLRLLPVAPFGLVSYGLGVSGIRIAPYLVGTVLGVVPSTVVYASLGANSLAPGSPMFLGSLAAAVVLAGLTAGGAALAKRRHRDGSHEGVGAERQPGAEQRGDGQEQRRGEGGRHTDPAAPPRSRLGQPGQPGHE